MPKGYIIARMDVDDMETFMEYAKRSGEAQKKYGAKVLVRGGKFEALEGTPRARNVVLEFPSYDAAKAYFDSAEYQAARPFRQKAAKGELLVVEGFDPDGH
jgi:uncharacterized protein (DUF1330 family)